MAFQYFRVKVFVLTYVPLLPLVVLMKQLFSLSWCFLVESNKVTKGFSVAASSELFIIEPPQSQALSACSCGRQADVRIFLFLFSVITCLSDCFTVYSLLLLKSDLSLRSQGKLCLFIY